MVEYRWIWANFLLLFFCTYRCLAQWRLCCSTENTSLIFCSRVFVIVHCFIGYTTQQVFLDCLTLKMKTVRLFETSKSVHQLTRRNIPRRLESSAVPLWEPRRVPLEKQIFDQPIKKFPAFYGTHRFIALFTVSRQWTEAWDRWHLSITRHPVSLSPINSPSIYA